MLPLSPRVVFFGFILLAVFFEVLADILFKKWALTSQTTSLVIGVLIYLLSTIAWAFSLKHEYLSKAISIFTVINLVAVVLVGALIFKEDLSLTNKLGILLGTVSVIMIQL